ncbi:MAG: hypothetical protein JSW25_09210 [Thermoplasmata archaeon]|nr:MAG: hypothetical protein JSW25_09210 [Thermoplasmata archaeon]
MCVLGLAAFAIIMVLAGSACAFQDEPPHWIFPPPQVIREDQEWTFDVSPYFWTDPANHTYMYRDSHPGIYTNPLTGVMTWTPTDEDRGDHFFIVTVTEDAGIVDMMELKITVEVEPGLLTFGEIPHFTLTQDVPFSWQVPILERDTWEEWGEVRLFNDHEELFTVDNQTGMVDFTPQNRHVGEWTVTFYLTVDGYTHQKASMHLTIVNRNDRPTLVPITNKVVKEGEPVNIDLHARDPDLNPRLGEPSMRVDPEEVLTFRTTLPHHSNFERSGQMTWIPTDADAKQGSIIVRFDVRDRSGQGDAMTTTFLVTDVEHPPKVQIIGIVEGQKIDSDRKIQLRGALLDEFDDPIEGCSYRWYAGIELIGDTQDLTWRVEGRGQVPIRLVVIDPEGQEFDHVVNVTIRVVTNGHPDIWYYIGLALPFIMVFVTVGVITFLVALWHRRKGYRPKVYNR